MLRPIPFLLIGLLSGACDRTETPTTPSSPGATQQIAVETFTGTLPVGGSSFYSFTVSQSGRVSLLLHQLTEAGAASTAQVTLGLGVPQATDCTVTSVAPVTAGATPQIIDNLTPAVYCARISDPGNLTAPAGFAVNIIRPR